MISSVASEVLILFLPQLLSPLHLASYYFYKKSKDREKELNRLSKKMILITNRFTKIEEEKINSLEDINYLELFYNVYRQVDKLTLRELKVLRNFCYALHNPYDLTIIKGDQKIEIVDEVYYKYSNELDGYMDKKTKRKIISKF